MSSVRAPASSSSAKALRLAAVLLLLTVGVASVGSEPLSLRVAGPDTVQVGTRRTITFPLKIENSGSKVVTLRLERALPAGWKSLTEESPFHIDAGANDLRLISILVPSSALAGTYSARYWVHDLEDPEIQAECTMRIDVSPEAWLEIRLLDSPRFVIAGEEYVCSFVVTNRGNTDLHFDLLVHSSSDFPARIIEIEGSSGTGLSPGSRQVVHVAVRTDPGLYKSTRDSLMVIGRLRPAESGRSDPATSVVEVVPVTAARTELMHSIRATIETSGAMGVDGDSYQSFQTALTAQGTLDENDRHYIELRLRKEMTAGEDLLLNSNDRYSMLYRNGPGEVRLGDFGYSLSPLLAVNEFGRGVQTSLQLGPLGAMGWYYQDVWSQDKLRALGGSVDFTVPALASEGELLYRAAIGMLSPLDGRNTFSLWQQFNPLDALHFQLDAAIQSDPLGGLHPAIYAAAEGEHDIVFYRAQFVRAWPGFQANYNDSQSIHLSGGVDILDRQLHMYGQYSLTDNNLELDPSLISASRSRRILFGALYHTLANVTELGIQGENSRWLDRLAPASEDIMENQLRFSWRQRLGFFGLKLASSLGQLRDMTDDDTALIQNHSLALQYLPESDLQADATLGYNHRLDDDGTTWQNLNWTAGFCRKWTKTRLYTQIRNQYSFDRAGYEGFLSGIEARLSHIFSRGNVLTTSSALTLHHYNSIWEPKFELKLTYASPLDIPVSHRTGISVIKGHVYRMETGEPLKGVVLRINGLAAVTDGKGLYTFHLSHSGRFHLQLDPSRLESNLIPDRPMPLECNAVGQEMIVDIGLVKAAGVGGNVAAYGFPEKKGAFVAAGEKQASDLPRVRLDGLGGVLVELANGVERRRRLTSPNGDFSFADVRPGHYTLVVIDGRLPSYHRLDPASLEVDLHPGQHETVEFRAVQEQRRIQMVAAEVPVVLEVPPEPRGERTVILQRPKGKDALDPSQSGITDTVAAPFDDPVDLPPVLIPPPAREEPLPGPVDIRDSKEPGELHSAPEVELILPEESASSQLMLGEPLIPPGARTAIAPAAVPISQGQPTLVQTASAAETAPVPGAEPIAPAASETAATPVEPRSVVVPAGAAPDPQTPIPTTAVPEPLIRPESPDPVPAPIIAEAPATPLATPPVTPPAPRPAAAASPAARPSAPQPAPAPLPPVTPIAIPLPQPTPRPAFKLPAAAAPAARPAGRQTIIVPTPQPTPVPDGYW